MILGKEFRKGSVIDDVMRACCLSYHTPVLYSIDCTDTLDRQTRDGLRQKSRKMVFPGKVVML